MFWSAIRERDMSNLYELSVQFDDLLATAEAEAINADGEISEAICALLDDAQMAKDEKIDNIIRYVKNLRGDAVKYKTEAMSLTDRARRNESKASSLERYLMSAGITKYETVSGAVKSTKSKAVEIDPIAVIPDEYMNVKTTKTPVKASLKKAILAGVVIDGVEIVERLSVKVK